MKSVHWLQEEAHPTSLDARFHGHDVIPAQAGIQKFAQILGMSQELYRSRLLNFAREPCSFAPQGENCYLA